MCLPTLGLVCRQLRLCLTTLNLQLWLRLSSLDMENLENPAHVWALTSVVLVLIKSVLQQRFGCWSGLHLNLTELVEILGEILKEFDLSQMCI